MLLKQRLSHLYCLDQLANRGFFQAFQMVESALRDAVPKGGYLAEVGKGVLERLPKYNLI
jgi:hypothetical protein